VTRLQVRAVDYGRRRAFVDDYAEHTADTIATWQATRDRQAAHREPSTDLA
jgi:hypothetical protein